MLVGKNEQLLELVLNSDPNSFASDIQRIDEILLSSNEVLDNRTLLLVFNRLFVKKDMALLEYLFSKNIFDAFEPDTLKMLLNRQDHNGNTLLIFALEQLRENFAKLLIEKGADVTIANKANVLPLFYIIFNEQWFDNFITQYPEFIHFRDSRGRNILTMAATVGQDKIIETLLKEGLDPLEPDNEGYLPMDAAKTNRYLAIFEILEKASLNKKQRYSNYINQTAAIRLDGGHPLGLSFEYEITNPITQRQVKISSEGEKNEFNTLNKLREFSEDYLKTQMVHKIKKREVEPRVKQHFEQVNEALKVAEDYINMESVDAIDTLIKRANDSTKLTIIPTSIHEHTLAVARFGDLLLITNRGYGKFSAGTTIFKLKPDVQFDEALIVSLFNKKFSMKELQNKLLELVDLDNYIGIPLPVKDQKFGTCSFVNPKSNIEAVLFAERFYELPEEERNAIFAGMKRTPLVKQEHESDKVFRNRKFEQEDDILKKLEADPNFVMIKQYAEEHYKNFTKFIRDSTIDNIIRKYQQAKEGSEFKKIYKRILAEYIIAHPGNPKKEKSRGKIPKPIGDLQRIEKILLAFDESERLEFMKFTEELLKTKPSKEPQIFKKIENNAKHFNIPSLIKLLELLDPNLELLLKYASEGDLISIQNLFQMHPDLDVNGSNKDNQSALMLACRSRNLELVQWLVEKKADLNALDNKGQGVVNYAILAGKPNIIKYINHVNDMAFDLKKPRTVTFSKQASIPLLAKTAKTAPPLPTTPPPPLPKSIQPSPTLSKSPTQKNAPPLPTTPPPPLPKFNKPKA